MSLESFSAVSSELWFWFWWEVKAEFFIPINCWCCALYEVINSSQLQPFTLFVFPVQWVLLSSALILKHKASPLLWSCQYYLFSSVFVSVLVSVLQKLYFLNTWLSSSASIQLPLISSHLKLVSSLSYQCFFLFHHRNNTKWENFKVALPFKTLL